jgi:hypothetical protein
MRGDHRIWTAVRQVTQKNVIPHPTSGNASSPAFSRQIGAGQAIQRKATVIFLLAENCNRYSIRGDQG